MILRLWAWLLAALQRRCPHPGSWVVADFLEGDVPNVSVIWCRGCGAIARGRGVDGAGDTRLLCRPHPKGMLRMEREIAGGGR